VQVSQAMLLAAANNPFFITLAARKKNNMNTLEIKGNWNITKGKLKQKWAKLTDNDLRYTEGQQEELVGRIQKLTGEAREVVENTIKEYSSACGCM
jgi:uncharacterized protein YjbJ (UPF0337 family)